MLYEEVDYRREGKNAERFSENFKGTDWIKAPSINWSRSTSKVFTKQGELGKRAASAIVCRVILLVCHRSYRSRLTRKAFQGLISGIFSSRWFKRCCVGNVASTKPVAKSNQGIGRAGYCGAPFACKARLQSTNQGKVTTVSRHAIQQCCTSMR